MMGVSRKDSDLSEASGQSLLFIGGAHGRCGTTLVKRLVATHRDVSPVTHGESRLFEFVSDCWSSLVWDDAYSPGAASQALARFRRSVTEQLGDSVDVRSALEALASALGTREMRLVGRARGLLPAPQSDAAVAASMSRFVVGACRAAALDPNAGYLLEKTPSNAQYVPLINRLLPSSPIIVMVRNPLAVALSHTRRPWGPADPVEAATYTAAYFRRWREIQGRTANCLVLRHEDLVADPELWMREVLDHLGLMADERVLRRARQEIRPAEDRTDDISQTTLRAMTVELEQEMDAFGYPIIGPTASLARVPLVRPALPRLRRVVPLMERVWSSSHVTNAGPIEGLFEEALRQEFGWASPVLTSNGTSALSLLLRALDLPQGDVIVPAFTFPALSQAITSCGMRPIEVDVDPKYLGLDPSAVNASIGPRTVAIFAAHAFGMPADIDGLEEVARAHSLPLLFDAAPAVGVRWRGAPLSHYGVGSAFSFHATKTFTTIEGGAATSNDVGVTQRMRQLRNFDIASPGMCSRWGTNAKSNDVLAAIGLAGLEDISKNRLERESLHTRYRENFRSLPQVRVLTSRPETDCTFSSMVVRLRSLAGKPLADEVQTALDARGIDARRYFSHRYRVGELPRPRPTPEADRAVEDVLCLPLWPGLSPKVVDRICEIATEVVQVT